MENESVVILQDISVGHLLTEARLARGLTLEDVAETLRIKKSTLDQLERNCESLTCDVYTLGFIRCYAQLLNLNAAALIQKFKDQAIERSPHLAFPTPMPEQGTPNFHVLFLSLFALALTVGVAGGYLWWERHHKISPQIPPVAPLSPPVATIVAPPVAPVQTNVAPPSPNSAVLAGSHTLLQASEETWIEVKDAEGEILLQRLFYPGESYTFENPEHLILKTGNAAGVSLTSGNKTLTFPGQKGEIKSGISLDSATWLMDAPERDSE